MAVLAFKFLKKSKLCVTGIFIAPTQSLLFENCGALQTQVIMTQSELQRVKRLLRLCDTNVVHCQGVVARSFALVERARTLIKICQNTVRDREAAALRNVEASR